jgi:hypothetical protein
MKRISFFALAAMCLFMVLPALADNWDQAACAPPSSGCNDSCAVCTTNELVHGTSQVHDVDDANSGLTDDEDWYFLSIKPYTSYEILVDGTTPYMNRTTPVSVALVQADGTLDTSDYAVSSKGFSRSLRVGNSTGTVQDARWVRVTAATDCGGACLPIDEYHIGMRETTYYLPRFNNSASQVSVLILQNPRDATVSGNLYFWSGTGTLLNSTPITLNAKTTSVINTSTIVPGASGSVTLSHNSTYGALAGKIVALEPATGFTFDTLMVPRVN